MPNHARPARRGRGGVTTSQRTPRSALREASALLARRARTESELRSALAGRHGLTELDAALGRLRALGYLDDAAWARHYVESRRGSVRGAGLLRRELLGRGVDVELAEEALAGRDELMAARAAARPRLRTLAGLAGLAGERRYRRLASFLARRGFAPAVVVQTLRELLGEEFEA